MSPLRKANRVLTMQAKDIDESTLLARIPIGSTSISRYDLAAALPDVPEKVLLAKLRSMVKRGCIRGCACGCRGDFTRAPDVNP